MLIKEIMFLRCVIKSFTLCFTYIDSNVIPYTSPPSPPPPPLFIYFDLWKTFALLLFLL